MQKETNEEENGFTYITRLQLDNDEGLYNYCFDLARETLEEGGEHPIARLAEKLKDVVEDMADPGKDASIYLKDLVLRALWEIDYFSIAQGYIEQIQEQERE